jgi:N-acetylglucosaminyl-diphospho-decaprenol L-rhamnosyltransferase
MILSVVIISYNVKFFLEQCLSSLKKAMEGRLFSRDQCEVFIVDNESSDGSLDFLVPLFPEFHFIKNSKNTGFARANNQALQCCTGEYILFLNPDTILAEDTLDLCISFFQTTPGCGALGIRMVDGSGEFLPESKRGFPDALTSFYKMSGLSRLFPRSKTLAAYYSGHLSHRTTQAVDILSGAFMMVRKPVLDKTGGFDEQFFMYAEDIDLSYRISKAGYRNYYFAETTIIHFKGESTRKDAAYVKSFYGAMKLFIKKHFHSKNSSLRMLLLNSGMRLRQGLAYIQLLKAPKLKPDRPLPVFILGDQGRKEYLKNKLKAGNIPITENRKEAGQIIYCEGPGQTWKSIIFQIQENKEPARYKFSGNDTHAIVGSHFSHAQGNVYEI